MSIWEVVLELPVWNREPRYLRVDVEAETFHELAERMEEVAQMEDGTVARVVGVERQA